MRNVLGAGGARLTKEGARGLAGGRSRRAAWLLLLLVTLGGAGTVAVQRARTAGAAWASYVPGPMTPRPAGESVLVPGSHAVRDFDGDGDWLYLLDPLAPAVRVLRRSSGQWQSAGSFGRRGGGPGEFAAPSGVAQLRDGRVAVVEPERIHFFTAAGTYLESRAPRFPCALPLPHIAGARHGLFVHGSCLLGGADTMAQVLLWSADGAELQEVARDARFTTNGAFGNAYGPARGLTDGTDRHLFGSGARPCVYRVLETDSIPVTERLCDARLRPFRLELSPETRASLEGRRRRSPLAAGPLTIPRMHPFYVERVVLQTGDGWLRSWAEDSLVLRLINDERDLAVLPYRGLIGCRRNGCLWAFNELEGVRITFLPLAVLDSLARSGGRGADRGRP